MGGSRNASLLFGYCIPRKLLAKVVAKKEREEEKADEEKKKSDAAAEQAKVVDPQEVAALKRLLEPEEQQALPAVEAGAAPAAAAAASLKRRREGDAEESELQPSKKTQRSEEEKEEESDSDDEDVGDIDGALAYCGYEDLDGQDSSDISIPLHMGRDDKQLIWVYVAGLDFHTGDKCNTTLEIKPKDLTPSKEQIAMLKKFAAEVGLERKKPRWFLRATGY